MKTNVPIVLEDEQLNYLACLIAGKSVKRSATRKEIIALCQQHIGGLLGVADPMPEPEIPSTATSMGPAEHQRVAAKHALYRNMHIPDPEDIPLMKAPSDPSYVYGWNKVKRGKS